MAKLATPGDRIKFYKLPKGSRLRTGIIYKVKYLGKKLLILCEAETGDEVFDYIKPVEKKGKWAFAL